MMFRIALETMGEDSSKGQEFADMWRYYEFRRMFQIITVVWGVMFLVESLGQAVIIETASINTAKSTSTFLPLIALALTFAWTRVYGIRAQRRGSGVR
jgi:tryptophan-rich sensory protein